MLSLHAQLGTEPRERLNSAVKLEKHKILALTCHEGHKSSAAALQQVSDD
jgi:hypothetical protein